MLLLPFADFFSKKFFEEHYHTVKWFGKRTEGSNLDPNCLQRLLADDRSHGLQGKS